jgi:hypothetical protein
MPKLHVKFRWLATFVVCILTGFLLFVKLFNESSKTSDRLIQPEIQSSGHNHIKSPTHGSRINRVPSDHQDPLNPREAENMLKAAQNNIPDIDERAGIAADVIKRLCLGGFTEEAWHLIESKPGQVRDFQLTAFFEYAQINTNEALAKMKDCSFNSDIQIAFSSYISRFELTEISDILMDSNYQSIFKELTTRSYPKLISNSVSMAFQNEINDASYSDQLNLLDQVMKFHSSGMLDNSGLARVVKLAKRISNEERWNIINSLDSHDNEVKILRNEIIGDMIRRDANSALDLVIATAGPHRMQNTLTSVTQWIRIDPDAAGHWFAANRHSFDDQQHDGAVLGFFQSAMQYGDKESAELWMLELKNQSLKQKAVGVLNKR